MSELAISPRSSGHDYLSRALALGLLLLFVLAVVSVVVRPFWTAWRDAGESIAASTTLLAGFARSAAALPALQVQLHDLGEVETAPAGLIDASNPPLAAARLQSTVKAIIESAGGQVRSVQDQPTNRSGSFLRVGIRLDIAIGTEALQKALYRIESAQPYMFVDNLSIRASEALQRPGLPSAGGSDLSVRLEVFGYIKAPAS